MRKKTEICANSSKESRKKTFDKKTKKLLWLSNILIIGGLLYLTILTFPILLAEMQYQSNKIKKIEYQIASPAADLNKKNPVTVSPLLKPTSIIPSSTDFSLIIEKINLNTTVQVNIDITAKEGYWKAIENGVAHAKGTDYPGQIGNTYLFAHSTINPLNINKYNAVFTLLHKLEKEDRIVTYYEGSRYDYYVTEKQIVDPDNTESLTKQYPYPTLTLQTCHPPGTNLKRLIIIARMKEENNQ